MTKENNRNASDETPEHRWRFFTGKQMELFHLAEKQLPRLYLVKSGEPDAGSLFKKTIADFSISGIVKPTAFFDTGTAGSGKNKIKKLLIDPLLQIQSELMDSMYLKKVNRPVYHWDTAEQEIRNLAHLVSVIRQSGDVASSRKIIDIYLNLMENNLPDPINKDYYRQAIESLTGKRLSGANRNPDRLLELAGLVLKRRVLSGIRYAEHDSFIQIITPGNTAYKTLVADRVVPPYWMYANPYRTESLITDAAELNANVSVLALVPGPGLMPYIYGRDIAINTRADNADISDILRAFGITDYEGGGPYSQLNPAWNKANALNRYVTRVNPQEFSPEIRWFLEQKMKFYIRDEPEYVPFIMNIIRKDSQLSAIVEKTIAMAHLLDLPVLRSIWRQVNFLVSAKVTELTLKRIGNKIRYCIAFNDPEISTDQMDSIRFFIRKK